MKTRQLLTFTIVVTALAAGWFGRGLLSPPEGTSPAPSLAGPCPAGAQPLYWKAPMDPTYIRDAPGKSPMGMDLVPECPGAAGRAPEGSVIIDSATMQNIGVRTAEVERRDLARAVRAVGRVAYDERRVSHVHTKVQGWVEKLFVDFVGQKVTKGQPLLEIYSPELVATQEELLLAARYRSATENSEFGDVRGGGQSLFEATKRRLALWDIPERDITRLLTTGEVKRTLTLYAPASGYITRLGVRAGMEVQPNANLYTIADLSHVWVLADVYEYELPWLELGQRARVELNYLPGEEMVGELTYIAPFLDPATRTAEVRLELDNSAGKLKPEMFGNAVIEAASLPDVVAVPTDAVIRSGTRSLAIVALGEGRFEPRDIELGLATGDGWFEVRSGLTEGESVVVSSQFLIDSESKLQEAVQKLLAASGAEDAHAGHRMEETEEDHSSHQHQPADPDDHSAHEEMDHAAEGEHEGHRLDPSSANEHAGHEGMPHADHSAHEQHQMDSAPQGDHSAHEEMDHSAHEQHQMPTPSSSQEHHRATEEEE